MLLNAELRIIRMSLPAIMFFVSLLKTMTGFGVRKALLLDFWFIHIFIKLAGSTRWESWRLRWQVLRYPGCGEPQLRRREKDLVHLVEERTIELERTNEILRQISYLDAVTGTSNRRRFDEMLDLEWRKAYRNRSFFSLIMLDIDLFKPFNDAYGHQSGDNCLKQVAGAINSQLRRAGDFLARYGGEEFVIILPEADTESAVSVADRIRTTVQSLGIPHSTSTVKKVVTISLGVATVLVDQQGSPQQLIAAADSALYRAKNLGRNQVVSEMIVLDEHGIVLEPLKKP